MNRFSQLIDNVSDHQPEITFYHRYSSVKPFLKYLSMSIKIYNTLTRKKEVFTPIKPGQVSLYVCGITSYDYCHIGHARSSLVFDMIVKYFKYRGYKVHFVRNFTDIDDKIISRAHEQQTSPEELANRFINEFYTDMEYLGIARPDREPKATEHIQDMIDLIQTLVDKGTAYPSGGDVYFSVNHNPEYGKLSGRNLEDMQAGARIDINENKRHPMDFALWKGSKPGEPTWDSPWGPGRPGWHIECSAMSKKYFGDTFDIHGGGKDLIFPHHENELAQSESANNTPFVHIWIHHGFVTVRNEETAETEKMSKSLGNFLTIRELSRKFHSEVLKLFIFSTHYRNPIEYSRQAMHDAETGLTRLYECIGNRETMQTVVDPSAPPVITSKDTEKLESMEQRFRQAMDNDFNTAQAIGLLFETAKTINKIRSKLSSRPSPRDLETIHNSTELLRRLAGIMGLLQEDAQTFLDNRKNQMLRELSLTEAEIDNLIEQRRQARQDKNWAVSDEIRDKLLSCHIELKDGPDGTTWSIKKNP